MGKRISSTQQYLNAIANLPPLTGPERKHPFRLRRFRNPVIEAIKDKFPGHYVEMYHDSFVNGDFIEVTTHWVSQQLAVQLVGAKVCDRLGTAFFIKEAMEMPADEVIEKLRKLGIPVANCVD